MRTVLGSASRFTILPAFTIATLLLVPASGEAQVCGDAFWEQDPCEFCGQDAYQQVGACEMNHDCVTDVLDFGYFAQDYGSSGPGLTGDFTGDGNVDLADFSILAAYLFDHHGNPVPDCDACNVVPDSCAGSIRISFDMDPELDVDRLDVPAGTPVTAFVVIEDTPQMTVLLWNLELSDNLMPMQSYGTGELDLGSGTSVFTEDDGAYLVGALDLLVTDDEPASVRLRQSADMSWDVAWAQMPPGRRMGFEVIAHGGINADPPADSLGCESQPPEPDCHDLEWQEEPCEFCGRDAYVATGSPEMNHDCHVGILDFALFGQEYGQTGEGLSGDFNGDQVVNLNDFAIFVAGYDQPVSPCNPCGVEADSCAGTVRISFDENLSDMDRLDLAPYEPAVAYIVAEQCPSLAAAHFLVYLTPNINISSVLFPSEITIDEQTVPYMPPFDEEAHLLAAVEFFMTDGSPGMLGVRGSESSGQGQLQWAQIEPLRHMGFARIAFGGINTDPRPDSLGCGFSDVPETPLDQTGDEGFPGDPAASAAGRLAVRAQPNPAFNAVTCAFRLDQPEEVRVEVLAATGRCVRRWQTGLLGPGEHAIHWDGRNDTGRPVPAGAYYVRVAGSSVAGQTRLLWLR